MKKKITNNPRAVCVVGEATVTGETRRPTGGWKYLKVTLGGDSGRVYDSCAL
jgi:hypothetical protein